MNALRRRGGRRPVFGGALRSRQNVPYPARLGRWPPQEPMPQRTLAASSRANRAR
jgi:hypothetical protein